MKGFFRQNGILLLVIALLLAAILGVSSMLLGGGVNPLANLARVITTPIQGAASSFAGWVEGLYEYSFQYTVLEEENARLKQENAALREQARAGEQAERENERYRELLGLREKRRDFVFESANVVSRDTTNWSSTLTVNKGTSHGVAVGDCAVDQMGNLVGVVAEAGLTWSTLITVIDADIEMGGLVSRTEHALMLEGDFSLMLEGKVKLTYLPESAQLLAGDLILTSGKGQVYPSGLVVGTVEGVYSDPSGLSQYAVVTPSAALDQVVQVFIIKEFDIIN